MQLASYNALCQVITGPNTARYGMSATYSVDNPSPDVKYHWTTIDSTGYITNPYTNYTNNHKVDIGWVSYAEKTIVVTDSADFSNPGATVDFTNPFNPIGNILPNNGNSAVDNYLLIDSALKYLHLNAGNGGGLLILPAGTYYTTGLFLREGIRILGAGNDTLGTNTTLKRYFSYGKNDPMFQTFKLYPNNILEYTFLSNSGFGKNPNINSKPIEISDLILDGDNPADTGLYHNEHGAGLFLDVPGSTPEPGTNPTFKLRYNNQLLPDSGYYNATNLYQANGKGRLKIYLHDLHFRNFGGDGVNQDENIDLTMYNCTGHSVKRGTFSITGGGGISRVHHLHSDAVNSFHKGFDIEMDSGEYGYGNTGFRAWIDSCNFEFKMHMFFEYSKLYVTNTSVIPKSFDSLLLPYGEIGFSGPGGNLIARNTKFPFNNVYNNGVNGISASMCANFINCEFKLVNNAGCANGFKLHDDEFQNSNSKLGFKHCNFIKQGFTTETTSGIIFHRDYTPTDIVFFLHDNDSNNHTKLLQSYWYDNGNNCAEFFDLGVLMQTDSSLVNPGGTDINICGETEDQMKSHYGYRKVTIDENFYCNTNLLNDTLVFLLQNPTAKEVLHFYGNLGTVSNKKFFIDGEFKIDTIIRLDTCLLYFTENSRILIDSAITLYLNESVLQASCDTMWDGIFASDSSSKFYNYAGTLRDMKEGVYLTNGAKINSQGSFYEDNKAGIRIYGMLNSADCKIEGNIFTTTNYLLKAPYAGEIAEVGIGIYNCNGIVIGNSANTALGNHFSNMYTGIFIKGDADIASILDTNTNHIGVYNNTFADIQYAQLDNQSLLSQAYTTPRGAAVYINYGNAPAFNAQTTVSYTNAGIAASPLFDNCNKGIVSINNRLTDSSLFMRDCSFGILNAHTNGKPYNITNNKIENTVIGIQCYGDDDSGSNVKYNIIDCIDGWQIEDTVFWSKGIDIRRFLNTCTNDVQIINNEISIPGFGGAGINVQNMGWGLIRGNIISLTYNDPYTSSPAPVNLLNGINVSNANGTHITRNTITGNNGLGLMAREDIAGILVNHCDAQTIECNVVQKSRFGIQAISRCITDTAGVKGNVMYNMELGWVFRHLGTEGTFGQVGGEAYDNNNQFFSTNQYKVFRFCDTNLQYRILTNPNTLDQLESKSNNAVTSCAYDVEPNTGTITTYTCPPIDVLPTYASNHSFSLTEAIQVATNTKTYSEYPEISHWMDARQLYRQLDHDSVFRVSNDTLYDFYAAMQNEIIEQINTTDTRLAELIAAMESQNYELYLQRMEAAAQNNSNIISNEVQENNEARINEIFLKVLELGIDSLTSDDSTFLTQLAAQCPYIGGTAVYKARMLIAMYQPLSMYDDIKLCNTIGVYKTNNTGGNTKGIFDDENNYLKSIRPKPENVWLSENDLIIFPNPASSQVNIRYKKLNDTKLQIVNLLGITVKEVFLPKETQQVSVLVHDLFPGIYTYRQTENKVVLKTGKLIISN